MSRKIVGFIALAVSAGLTGGCGTAAVEESTPSAPAVEKKPTFRLDAPIEVSLSKLRLLPRQQLARLAQEITDKIDFQERNLRSGELAFTLLPAFRAPRAIPIFRDAKFSPTRKFSLPSYLDGRKNDEEVAEHLARFGDVDAALQLVPRSDTKAIARIKASGYRQNYPLEWTRLAALQIYAAEMRLATGDEEGARLLVGLHHQLEAVLDADARAGLLGRALLPRGRVVLAQAAAAWFQANQSDLAREADAAVASWGKFPAGVWPIHPGMKQAAMCRLLDSPADGHAVVACPMARAFDLLALPLPDRDADAVITCFDAKNRLVEMMVVYRPGAAETFSQPGQLGHLLGELLPSGQEVGSSADPEQGYRLGGFLGEVTVVPQNTAAGALVRFRCRGQRASVPALPRRFGPVDFDRSFEHNRLLLAPDQGEGVIALDDKQTIDRVGNPLPALAPARITLQGNIAGNVVMRFTAAFAPQAKGLPGLAAIARPLWAAGGATRRITVGPTNGGGKALLLAWEDGATRYTLGLPNGRDRGPELTISPIETNLPKRIAEVAGRERAERRLRFEKEQLRVRIPRTWEKITLGKTRAQVEDALPIGKGILRRPLPDGLAVIIKRIPEEHGGYIPRELFIRFGPDERVAEVRVRYTDAPGTETGGGIAGLLADIKQTCGAPRAIPSAWAAVWADLPERHPAAVAYSWQDDVTHLTVQRDSEGVELAARRCGIDQEAGVPLPPFQAVTPGPQEVKLADRKADLLRRSTKLQPHVNKQGALELTPPETSPYGLLVVSFDRADKVGRIVALYKPVWQGEPTDAQLANALRKAWANQIEAFGWPRREDVSRRGATQAWTNHDEAARVSVFWQRSRSGNPQMLAEWKRLSVPK